MSSAEFTSYRDRIIPAVAAQCVQVQGWNPDHAHTLAARVIDNALPAGLRTPGMLLLVAENEYREYVGDIWIALDQSRPGNACLQEIEIMPEHRHKGYGYALAEAAAEQARQLGANTITGQVLATNEIMRHAAEAAGYEVIAVIVRKSLGQAG
ncbi:MAG: GNAT family N-acetyltransferase [Mycobacterium sp.]|nr:GNAT family N-acetyltransferase [Mycobacterium sp.]